MQQLTMCGGHSLPILVMWGGLPQSLSTVHEAGYHAEFDCAGWGFMQNLITQGGLSHNI